MTLLISKMKSLHWWGQINTSVWDSMDCVCDFIFAAFFLVFPSPVLASILHFETDLVRSFLLRFVLWHELMLPLKWIWLNRVEHEEIERISFLGSFSCSWPWSNFFGVWVEIGRWSLRVCSPTPLWWPVKSLVAIYFDLVQFFADFMAIGFLFPAPEQRSVQVGTCRSAQVQRSAAHLGAMLSDEQLHRSSPSLSPTVSLCARRRAAAPPALLSLLAFPHRFNELRAKWSLKAKILADFFLK